ncbi:MAG: hypothetical protein HOY71_19410, partial [Nonomuraea sp.]|nr:hypothetical protein [Nonomuraea sp.]
MSSPLHPCAGCGASLVYEPGTIVLRCTGCGQGQRIDRPDREVSEHDYAAFLTKPRVPATAAHLLACPGCEARTESDAISTVCQFCGAALVADTAADARIAPEAVLPFALARDSARDSLRTWV